MVPDDVSACGVAGVDNTVPEDCFEGRPRLIRHFFFGDGSVRIIYVDRIVRFRVGRDNYRWFHDRGALVGDALVLSFHGRLVQGRFSYFVVLNVRFRRFEFCDPIFRGL